MNFFYEDGPIIACSTPTSSNGAIGIVRLSGFSCLTELQTFFSFPLIKVSPRRVFLTNILSGHEGQTLDEALGVYFEAPQSYNGENILELSVHGNQINIQQVLYLFANSGKIRMALPGEFSYRALKNKKMTLSQVEGLDLILNGTSSFMLSQGQALIHGKLQENYLRLHEVFLGLKTALELNIDFLEDVGEEEAAFHLQKTFQSFRELVFSLHRRTGGTLGGGLLSPEIVLAGPTNAGKSSFFNSLLKMNRSIVSPQAGTTRDYVSEFLFIRGISYRLIDTAGIRESGDEIEREGIQRSLDLLSQSFYRILVINPFDADIEVAYFHALKDTQFDLLVFTHLDKEGFENKKEQLKGLPPYKDEINVALADFKSGPIGPLSGNRLQEHLEKGSIVERVFSLVSEKYVELAKDDPIIVERHRHVIKEMASKVEDLEKLMNLGNTDMGILSHELYSVEQLVIQLIGVVSTEDVLTEVFSNFCIGK